MLTGKDKRQLRALGHHLTAVVLVGSNGVTPGVVEATKEALKTHELIKAKFSDEDRDSRQEGFLKLAAETKSDIAQTMGRTVLLFRKRSKNSKIILKTAKGEKSTEAKNEEEE